MQVQTLPTLNISRFSMLFLVPQFFITSENMAQDSMNYYTIKKRFAEVSFFSKTDSEKINKEIISQAQKGETWRCTLCIMIIMIKWSVTQTLKWNHQKQTYCSGELQQIQNWGCQIWLPHVILLFSKKILTEDTSLSFFLCCKVWCLHVIKSNKKIWL